MADQEPPTPAAPPVASRADRSAALPTDRIIPYDEFSTLYIFPTPRPSITRMVNIHYGRYFRDITKVVGNSTSASHARATAVRSLLTAFANVIGQPSFEEFFHHPDHVAWANMLNATQGLPGMVAEYRLYLWGQAQHDAYASIQRDLAIAAAQAAAAPAPQPATAPNVERCVTAEDAGEDCVICYEAFVEGEMITKLPCVGDPGHWFHTPCIVRWLASGYPNTCPNRCAQRPA